MTDKSKSMSTAKKALLGMGGFVLLLSVISAAASPAPKDEPTKELVQATAQVKDASTKQSTVEVKTVEEAVPLPYQSTTQNDGTLLAGKAIVAVAGVNGEKVVTYKVTYTDGAETAREQTSERVSRQPINEVKKIGTKVAVAPKIPPPPAPTANGNCSPNYSGCVPIASDVDCAGGSGNGPAYVSGPVNVIGYDIYDLDRDGNGVGCES